jgi:hypothetical protein
MAHHEHSQQTQNVFLCHKSIVASLSPGRRWQMITQNQSRARGMQIEIFNWVIKYSWLYVFEQSVTG